jgi:hypothetical protein
MANHLNPPPNEMHAPEGTSILMRLCADDPTAVVSFPLTRLPDELVLQVVAQVPEADLRNLSLASSHVGIVAQEALHRCPIVPYANDTMPQRIAQLARTLFSRPDLARSVVRLILRPIIHLVEIPFTTLSAADNTALQGFFQHTRVYMGETQIVALLLASLLNLKELDLQILVNGSLQELHSGRYGHACSVQCKLPDKAGSHPFDVAMNPGLKKLRKLELHARHISWDWLALPCLKAVTLSRHCSVDWDTASAGVSRVEELVLNLSTEVFLDGNRRYRELPKLFSRMPLLRSLTINMSNKCLAPGPSQEEGDILQEDTRGSMENLIDTMYAVSRTLEVLCIKESGTNRDYLHYLSLVTSLVHFNQMKYIQIPSEGILVKGLVSKKRIAEILPKGLEKLRLTGLCVEAMEGLKGMCSDDTEMAFLTLMR